jgi:hypothetical protein
MDTCSNTEIQMSLVSQLTSNMGVVVFCCSVTFIAGYAACFFFDRVFHGLGTDKSESDKPFTNGVSWVFFVKFLTLDTLVKLLSQRARRRLYVAHKHYFFFGAETWWIGHPAIAAKAFAASQQKYWRKLTKDETLRLFYLPGETKKDKREAMLYTGDDEGWRLARANLTPFFYMHDFTKFDERMDAVLQKHLNRVVTQNHGEAEMLELLLMVTVDLLCQNLWHCTLPHDELVTLTEAMAEYIVPGTHKQSVYPGGLSALE